MLHYDEYFWGLSLRLTSGIGMLRKNDKILGGSERYRRRKSTCRGKKWREANFGRPYERVNR